MLKSIKEFAVTLVLGCVGDEALNRDYDREVHDDVIQVDVPENYYHLTDKTVAAFYWVTNFCREASYFIKVDDDLYFDLEILREIQNNEDYIPEDVLLGSCFNKRSPHRISTKWKISYEEYPFKTYPPYCTGSAYAMTLSTALKIQKEMRTTKLIKLEDIYIAIIVYRLGMSVKNEDYFVYDVNPFMFDYWLFNDFYIRCHKVVHYITPDTVQELWDKRDTMGSNKNDCSSWGKVKHLLSYIL